MDRLLLNDIPLDFEMFSDGPNVLKNSAKRFKYFLEFMTTVSKLFTHI